MYWTEEEVKILTENYNKISIKELLKLLPNRTQAGIKKKAGNLDLRRCFAQRKWSEKEIVLLKEVYPKLTWKKLIEIFNRGKSSIESKALKMGLSRGNEEYMDVSLIKELDILNKKIVKMRIVRNNLEKCESPIEKIFYIYAWDSIEQLEPQYWIGNYRVDFAIPNKKIIIELDGKQYHDNFNKKRSTSKTNEDYERQIFLQKYGWKVIRFTGSQIYNNTDYYLKQVLNLLN